jgi:aminotransferase
MTTEPLATAETPDATTPPADRSAIGSAPPLTIGSATPLTIGSAPPLTIGSAPAPAPAPTPAPTAPSPRLAERVRAVPPSGIRRFFDVVATMPDVISLGVGEPDFDTPPRVVEAGIRSLRAGRTHYTSNYGTLELRRALASHLERRYGVSYDPTSEIVITVGASEALAASFAALVDPGDEVVLGEPSYVAYMPGIVFNGGVPVFVPTRPETGWQLDPEAVEASVTRRTKVLFLGYPCNPTGAVLEPGTLRALADIARRHDLLVISDEIYDRLVYGGHRHEAVSSLPGMRERTILLGGFSKAYAMTGWRVGYACAPADLLEGIVKIHQYGIMSAPTTGQDAALEALTSAEDDVERMVEEYDHRRRMFVAGLNELGLPTVEPRGAFYAFPRISGTGLTSAAFSERLLFEQNVAVIPGEAFGPSGQGYVRASLATSYEGLEEALRRIGRFLASLG